MNRPSKHQIIAAQAAVQLLADEPPEPHIQHNPDSLIARMKDHYPDPDSADLPHDYGMHDEDL